MGKSIFTMSAAQRLKAQQKQSKRFDRAVNKKFKAMKKAWKKKIAGKVLKGTAFVATAAVAGAAVGKVKEIVKTKSGDELREMASKIKVKFEEKKAAMKKQETGILRSRHRMPRYKEPHRILQTQGRRKWHRVPQTQDRGRWHRRLQM